MEILNNFSSIYCFIAFILGAMFMFTTLCVAAMCKTQEQKNRVHFYVARDQNESLWLYIGKPRLGTITYCPTVKCEIIGGIFVFPVVGLDENDYDNLKFGDEPVEVFLNMEE